VACEKISFCYQIWLIYLLGTKTKMAYSIGSSFPGIIDEITLSAVVGFIADYLNGVLVCTYSSIRSKPIEQTLNNTIAWQVEFLVIGQARKAHIIVYTDREVILWMLKLQIIEYCLDHGRCKFIGSEPISPAHHCRPVVERCRMIAHCLPNCSSYIFIEGLANRARFFCAIENRN